MTLDFQPGLVSGGRLSQEEYVSRKQQCTQEALASLQASAEFKLWDQQRRRSMAAAHPTLAAVAMALMLLLAASAGAYGYWANSTAMAGTSPRATGLAAMQQQQLASQPVELDPKALQLGSGELALVPPERAQVLRPDGQGADEPLIEAGSWPHPLEETPCLENVAKHEQPGTPVEPTAEQVETEVEPAQQRDAVAEPDSPSVAPAPPAEDEEQSVGEEAIRQAQAALQLQVEELQQRLAQQTQQAQQALAVLEAALQLRLEESLAQQEEAHQQRLGELQDALGREEAQAKALEVQLKRERAQAEVLEQQLKGEQAHAEALEQQLNREQAQATVLEQQLRQEQAQAEALSQQLNQEQAQARELQDALGRNKAQAKVLSQHLADAVALRELADLALVDLTAEHSALQERHAQLQAQAAAPPPPPQLPQCPLDGQLDAVADDTCPNGVPPAVVGAWPELYMLYSAGTLVLLGLVACWRLHVRSVAAAAAAAARAATEKAANSEAAKLLASESLKVAQLQKELDAVKLEAAVLAEASDKAEASSKDGPQEQLVQAHKALLQVQGELEQQLQEAREEAAYKAQEAEREREAFLEVQAQLEEQREWHSAAQKLAAFTAAALSACGSAAAAAGAKGTASPLRAPSPTKRAPLVARSRNSSQRQLRESFNDENSPAMASPLPPAGPPAPPPSIAAAAAAALAAKRADTPRAWLDLLQARFSAVREQAATAERAAAEAEAALDSSRKENSWHQQKVSEMVTDIELLKERLADAKRGFQTASTEERQAKEVAAALQASVEELQSQAEGQQVELARRLEAVEDERGQLAQRLAEASTQLEELQAQLTEAQARGGSEQAALAELAAKLAQREGEAAELGEALAALEKENSSLEAQADQVTAVLEHTQRHKVELEKKVAQLEQELSSLTLLAEKLEGDKAVLEEQLEEARRTHAELCAAGKQLAAAESTIHHINRRSETPDAEGDLRRAISEKVAALDLLASAEKLMLEREAQDDLAPLPTHSNLRSTSRANSGIGSLDDTFTPRSRSQKVLSYFSSKLDRVARLMSGDAHGDRESMPGTPRSIASAPGGIGMVMAATPVQRRSGSAAGHRVSEGVSAWIDRLNQSFSHVDRVLHQDLAGFDTPSAGTMGAGAGGSPTDSGARSEGVERAQEALEYSAAEVVEVLAALDAAEQMEDHATPVAPVKDELHSAHMAVQAAMREVQNCNSKLELHKGSHRDMLQEFQRLGNQVELASELVDTEVQVKAQMEERVQGAQERLAAAEADLERALQQKLAAEAALGGLDHTYEGASEGEGEGVESELWEARLATNHKYERCLVQQRTCLEEVQSALAAKKEALERLAAVSARLEAAEVQHEDMADALDHAEADLKALAQQRLSLAGALSAAQRRQAAALQVAVGALERCLSPTEEGEGENEHEQGDKGPQEMPSDCTSPVTSPETSQGSSRRSSGSQAAVPSPAEVAAVLLDEGWGWEKSNSLASKSGELHSLSAEFK